MTTTTATTTAGSNMYKIGDYVYFEISSTAPYQIRRIEELNKTATGNVEAKVMSFYRRRDISPTLLTLADRHQSTTQPSCSSNGANNGDNSSSDNVASSGTAEAGKVKSEHGDSVDAEKAIGETAMEVDLDAVSSSESKPTMVEPADVDDDQTAADCAEESAGVKQEETSASGKSGDSSPRAVTSAAKPGEDDAAVSTRATVNGHTTDGFGDSDPKPEGADQPSSSSSPSDVDNITDINDDSCKKSSNNCNDDNLDNSTNVPTKSSSSSRSTSSPEDLRIKSEKSPSAPDSSSSTAGNGLEGGGPTVGLLGMEKLTEHERHRLKHRELFLSRQIETLPATHIRGKCAVTLLNEMETPDSYLGKDDCFFYSLVYDPQQRTLLADKGEIRIGDKYQATISDWLPLDQRDGYRAGDMLETLVFHPVAALTERQIDQFLIVARAVGTFSRALDSSSAAKQPSLHMSAAAASRDVTLFHALSLLHHANYDLGKAMCFLVPPPDRSLYPLNADKTTGHRTSALGGPLLCRDQLEEWSAAEAVLFEEALEKYGKDFNDIRQDFLPWKSLRDIVEYYYMWKTTDRYIHQKRFKAVEAESRLKQVYIPTYNKPNPAAMNPANPPGQLISCGKQCEGCSMDKSTQWYTWGPLHNHFRLCQDCWTYWKKCGGLKKPHKLENYDKIGVKNGTSDDKSQATLSSSGLVGLPAGVHTANLLAAVAAQAQSGSLDHMIAAGGDQMIRCVECRKPFESVDKLNQHKAVAHALLRCQVEGCRREFRGRAPLNAHYVNDHRLGNAVSQNVLQQLGGSDRSSPMLGQLGVPGATNSLLPGSVGTGPGGRAGPKVPRQPFYLHTTMLTRVARRLAPKPLLSSRRNARNPFLLINVAMIKSNCTSKPGKDIQRVARSIITRSLGTVSANAQREQMAAAGKNQEATRISNEARKRHQNGLPEAAPPMKLAKPNLANAEEAY